MHQSEVFQTCAGDDSLTSDAQQRRWKICSCCETGQTFKLRRLQMAIATMPVSGTKHFEHIIIHSITAVIFVKPVLVTQSLGSVDHMMQTLTIMIF